MAEKAKLDSREAGIEPKVAQSVQPAATPRLDPREAAEVSENALFPVSSELNALMEVIKDQEQKTANPKLQLSEVVPLEPIIGTNGQPIDFENLDPTAVGIAGAGESDGSTFVRLLRIVENVDPVSYNYGFNPLTPPEGIARSGGLIVDSILDPPPAPPPGPPEPPAPPPPPGPPEPPENNGKRDNGFGNGDDNAPGNSLNHNNAENAGGTSAQPGEYPGNSNNNGNQDVLNPADVLSDEPPGAAPNPGVDPTSLLFDLGFRPNTNPLLDTN